MFRAAVDRRVPVLVANSRRRSGRVQNRQSPLFCVEEQGSKDRSIHGSGPSARAHIAMGGRIICMARVNTRRRTGRRLLYDLSQRRPGTVERHDTRSRAVSLAQVAGTKAIHARGPGAGEVQKSRLLLSDGRVDKNGNGHKPRLASIREVARASRLEAK